MAHNLVSDGFVPADHLDPDLANPWGIAFGNGRQDQPTNVLFFAAGPEDEEHGVYGVYGRIELIP